MFRSRPVQYLGLLLLVLACLGIIFYPIGRAPEPQDYTVRVSAPQTFEQLLKADKKNAGKTPVVAADDALAETFPAGIRVPTGKLVVLAGGREATITDRAKDQAEAKQRVDLIQKALAKPFKGVKTAPVTEENIANLPQPAMLTLGSYAVRQFQPRTAINLGLDLQGGVNLVLQVRRALFTYSFDKTLAEDADERDTFVAQVRQAIRAGGSGLDEADVNLSAGSSSEIQIRTQAKDEAEFNAQKGAIEAALKNVQGVKFTQGREPQFYVPKDADGQQQGFATGSEYSGRLLDNTVEIVRSRVDKLGVSEPQIQKQEPDRVIVQLPGVRDPQRAVEVIGTTAQMRIVLLPEDLQPRQDPSDPNNTLFTDSSGNIVPNTEVLKRSQPIVEGEDVRPNTTAGFTEANRAAVFFELGGKGSESFATVTRQVAGKNRFIPIFLDERCISAPTVESPITQGRGQISGGFENIQEARDLALLLNSGALPAPIDVVENRTISATLGEDSLRQSLNAGMIGLLAVMVFMIAFYRLPGLLANFALIIYLLLNLAAFILIGGTLTLPGVAGFLLAVAMSLDTNILVFERLKEEMAIQPTFVAALRAAFSRAWTAILDSHVTTLIAAVVLFYFGTGPVKGFALTLGIGVLLSLFSAISVTRLFMWSVAGSGERNRNLFGKPVERADAQMAAGR